MLGASQSRRQTNPPTLKKPAASKTRPKRKRADRGPPNSAKKKKDHKGWTTLAAGPELPAWADHCVDVLQEYFQDATTKIGKNAVINVWADCCGMVTEMHAGNELMRALERFGVEWALKPYFICDTCKACRKFAAKNYAPLHTSTNMYDRNFEDGTFDCSTCGFEHDIPTTGIDFYMCGFPCGPWSMRGLQRGFEDADGDLGFQAIKTIKLMKPCFFGLENVMGLDAPDSADPDRSSGLETIMKVLEAQTDGLYQIVQIKKVEPTLAGFPVMRPRVFIMGARADQSGSKALRDVVETVVRRPVPLTVNYRDFLGLNSTVNFERLGNMMTDEEIQRKGAMGCSCGFNPLVICIRHPCACKACTNPRRGRACEWRCHHLHFIDTKLAPAHRCSRDQLSEEYKDRLMYSDLPQCDDINSPRQRNLMNLLVCLPGMVQSLKAHQPVVADKGQKLQRSSLLCTGAVPTLACNADMWSFPDAKGLSVMELAKLMGHDASKYDLADTSMTAFRHMLGSSIHVGTLGLMMACLFATLGEACR